MKIVFAGTSEFADVALKKLVDEGYEVSLVLTQPDRPAGRGRKLTESPVKKTAKQNGLTVMTPRTLRRTKGGEETAAVFDAIRKIEPDLLIVASYGLIIPQELLDIPKGLIPEKYPEIKALNIHGSLLPKWRGAAPIARGLEAGDTEAGITLMVMDAGLDTGPMLWEKAIPIEDSDTAGTLTEKDAKLGAEMLIEYLRHPQDFPPQKQPEGSTYASKLDKSEGVISWETPAKALSCKIRAFNPFPGCVFKHEGNDVKVWFASDTGQSTDKAPGTILQANKDGIDVACGQNTVIRLEELQKPGGKKLKARDFLNGYSMKAGDILG
ncbi:MAG: methionyl-tRNA formyltransferase [Burkholderiales bacterium]|nr:methionyl-tRNA formyltransferase [Burkholderiales bacterium]